MDTYDIAESRGDFFFGKEGVDKMAIAANRKARFGHLATKNMRDEQGGCAYDTEKKAFTYIIDELVLEHFHGSLLPTKVPHSPELTPLQSPTYA